jgi:hypothetical protein
VSSPSESDAIGNTAKSSGIARQCTMQTVDSAIAIRSKYLDKVTEVDRSLFVAEFVGSWPAGAASIAQFPLTRGHATLIGIWSCAAKRR